MKSLAKILFIALIAACVPALAAPTVAESNAASATSIALTVACAPGDLIFAFTQGGTAGTPTISDTVNTGNYTSLGNYPGVSFDYLNLQYIICNASGTPTINVTGVAVDRVGFIHWSSFTGTATVITGDTSSGTAISTALASGSFNTTKANEYAVGFLDAGGCSGILADPSGWNPGSNAGSQLSLYSQGPVSTIGTAVSMSATCHASGNWIAAIMGFYDASSSGGSSSQFFLLQ